MFESLLTLHNLIIFWETVFFIYASFLAGALFLNYFRIDLKTGIKKLIYPVMLGYGIFGFVGFLLAVFGLFYAVFLRMFLVLILLLSARMLTRHFFFLKKYRQCFDIVKYHLKIFFTDHSFLKVIVVLWVLANISIVFVPITGHDTVDYHLPIIFKALDNDVNLLSVNFSIQSGIFGTDSVVYIPVFAEIMYAVPSAIFNNFVDPFIFQLLQYSALILFLLLLYDFLDKKIENKFLKIVLLVFVMAIFDFQREVLHGGYVDIFVFLFSSASTLLIMENIHKETPDKKELGLSAVMLGLGLAIKYVAGFFAVINGLFLLFGYIRKRITLQNLILYALIILMVCGFWYARNTIHYGNPVYPVLSDAQFDYDVGTFIMERNILNFFYFPFFRFGQWFIPDQVNESSSRLVVFGYFVLAYLLLAFFIFTKKKFNIIEIMLFSFVELYLLFSFYMAHQIRFMLPAVIMLVLLLIFLLDKLYIYLKEKMNGGLYKIFMKFTFAGLYFIFILFFLANFHYFYVKYNYLIGVYDKAEYINEIGGM